MENSHRFFANTGCRYYPCHEMEGELNCLFCYCPLYALGEACGGNFTYTASGIKDCSACLFPHVRENYGAIQQRFREVARLAAKREQP